MLADVGIWVGRQKMVALRWNLSIDSCVFKSCQYFIELLKFSVYTAVK